MVQIPSASFISLSISIFNQGHNRLTLNAKAKSHFRITQNVLSTIVSVFTEQQDFVGVSSLLEIDSVVRMITKELPVKKKNELKDCAWRSTL